MDENANFDRDGNEYPQSIMSIQFFANINGHGLGVESKKADDYQEDISPFETYWDDFEREFEEIVLSVLGEDGNLLAITNEQRIKIILKLQEKRLFSTKSSADFCREKICVSKSEINRILKISSRQLCPPVF